MSDEKEKNWQRLRELFEKAGAQKLSRSEEAEIELIIDKLKLEPNLGCRIDVVEPHVITQSELDDHYRRKAELDHKFFGGESP